MGSARSFEPTTPGGERMATKNKQLNVRIDAETSERLERLVTVGSEATRLSLSQADVIRLALIALEEKYATEAKGKKASK